MEASMFKDGDKGAIIQHDKTTYAIAPHLVCGLADPQTLRKTADVAGNTARPSR